MDKRDLALQRSFPSVMMPKYGSLEPAQHHGERLIIASNGVFLEISRLWGLFTRLVSGPITTPIPYGACKDSTTWLIPPLPLTLLNAFDLQAGKEIDREIGVSILWNPETGYRLAPVQVLHSSGGHLKYVPPPLLQNDHLIIDCHSHARYPAFFSNTDDIDDAWDVKIAYVVGNCDQSVQSRAIRLCLKGKFEHLQMKDIYAN